MPGTRRLTIEIAGDARGATSAFGDADRAAGSFGSRISGLGTVAVAGMAAVGTAVAGAAAGLYSVGASFDSAFDTIRVATGATGTELEGLEESFRNVARESASSFDDIATALSEVAQRTGLSGGALEAITDQFLTLSRVTDTDLSTNIENVTRLFGDWGITVDDQAERMDQLFRASQASGVGVDQLAASVTQFGGPLRQLGFSLDESLAMIGRFEREGVNTELVLGSMRQALGRMARAGEAPVATFQRVTDEIQAAGSAGEANAIALELFGARAGPDMAAAIREGRFEIGDMLDTISNGTDTINAAGRDTEDFGEKWQRIKNRVFLALEPVATAVFNAVGTAMDRLGPKVDQFAAWFTAVIPPAIAAVKQWVDANWPPIQTKISAVMDAISTVVSNVLGYIAGAWRTFGDDILRVVDGTWQIISAVIEGAMNVIQGVINTVMSIIHGDFGQAWEGIQQIVRGVIIALGGVVRGGFDQIAGVVGAALNLISATFHNVWEGILNFFRAVPGTIANIARGMWDGITASFRGAINSIIGIWNNLRFPSVTIGGGDPLGAFGPSIPTVTIGGWDLPNIPYLHSGGRVNFGSAGEGLAMLRNDEVVVTPEDQQASGQTIVLQNHGVIGSEVELERWLSGALANLSRKGRLTGLRT